MRISLTLLLVVLCSFVYQAGLAQKSFPVNGIADPRETVYAFTNATIYVDADRRLDQATMLIRKNKIMALGSGLKVPADAVIIDCKGKHIYPSFIDLYSSYGVETPSRDFSGFNPFSAPQIETATKGPYSWNQALKPEVEAAGLFTVNDKQADTWRQAGFGTVLTHKRDGIARGTGVLVTLANTGAQLAVLKEKASAHYSFNRGTSTQSYPSSLMGAIALLRQTYLDAQWYQSLEDKSEEGKNLSLEAWNRNQNLPQIFEANDKWNNLRAHRIAAEFGRKYILKAGGNEYQRIGEMKQTGATFVLPLDFPRPMDVEDPNDARFVALSDLRHWQLADGNPAAFERAGIMFSLTADGLKDSKSFFANLQRAIAAGLSEKAALDALTKNPAQTLHVYDIVGSLHEGKLANFIITDKPIFEKGVTILQNWIQGIQYDLNPEAWTPSGGVRNLVITYPDGRKSAFTLNIKSGKSAQITAPDTLQTKFSDNGQLVQLTFSPVKPAKREAGTAKKDTAAMDPATREAIKTESPSTPATGDDQKPESQRARGLQMLAGTALSTPVSGPLIRLSGISGGGVWQGNGLDTAGNMVLWTATPTGDAPAAKNETRKRETATAPGDGKITYPFGEYGWEKMPAHQDILIRNATVWTSEDSGVLTGTDVFVSKGKIAAIGKNLGHKADIVIDATGMHLTPGIIDEHSHIAVQSINEGGQSVTSEVRIGDNLNPDDINIYRQLSGGVTTSQILHGSANTIGGQSQLIKLRWGANDTALKFENAPPFIKFALGENVKRTTSRSNNRFPNTRMGVDEVLRDAFTRARDYESDWKAYNNRPKNSKAPVPRRDLELDALVEILNGKRFITSHSYVASEILAAMRVAEDFGFKYNTFTHILEGYKVADEMKKHGVHASTFSDWWNYKTEVIDAIPQNAAIMSKMGVNTAINSDDAEMARRLNQEAAKSLRYGLTEEEALKMITINPATMLRIQDRVGSIRTGKDADLVLWNSHPLSVYAVAQKTLVDGIIYFDRERDMKMRTQIREERNKLIQNMNNEKRSGAATVPAFTSNHETLHCEAEVNF